MRLRYLPTSEPGLRWMRRYFHHNPQLDRRHVVHALRVSEQTLIAFPLCGELFEDYTRVREYHIRGTPFSLLYMVEGDTVWIIDVRDTRGQRSAETLRRFVEDLRRRSGLLP